jgi:hypothetical protein
MTMNCDFNQTKVIEFIKSFPAGVMIPVFGRTSRFDTDAYFQCRLIPLDAINKELCTDDTNLWWRMVPQFTVYGDDEPTYERFGNDDGAEPLIIERDFHGLGVDNEVEITEEFRLLNNLYFDRSKQEYIDLENDDSVVVKVEKNYVTIHKNYLKRYLAVKNMALVVHLDSRSLSNYCSSFKMLPGESVSTDSFIYTLTKCVDDANGSQEYKYSSLYAKLILRGCALEKCGYLPYDKENREYEEFVLGLDKDGNERTFTSNPGHLSSYLGGNPGAPHYLTPVFFKREVLHKYYEKPDIYSVEAGILCCGTVWSLQIDNENSDYISAYLGDLGRDLPPQKEQQHWKIHNIAIDGRLSDAKFKQDFLALWSNSENPVFRFQTSYWQLNKDFEECHGWRFFLNLNAGDAYNLTGLRVPINNSQSEFDMQILCLVKVIIDSMNEKKLNAVLSEHEQSGNDSGISKLEHVFEILNIQGGDRHIRFLRNLQGLRSTGTGHRKGGKYETTSKKFGLPEKNFKDVFSDIITKSVEFIEFIGSNIERFASGDTNA